MRKSIFIALLIIIVLLIAAILYIVLSQHPGGVYKNADLIRLENYHLRIPNGCL